MNLITLTNPQSVTAEAYRTLRTNLYFASLETPLKTIVVTSPSAVENRAVVLANLAVVLAQSEKKVIAVDADMRHPSVHELFGLPNERGLGDMLVDESLASRPPLNPTTISGLQVLTSGKVQQNPLDLLNSQRMNAIISSLTGLADVVLFNAPPMSGVSDTAILASQTDGVLLVVELGKTHREQAQAAKDLLSRAHARLLGAVMANT
jgi:capsular exopolysaccharide synthesis family protein